MRQFVCARARRLIAAYREFIREITLRFERGVRSLSESRAQRQALLHILDRLDNGGTAPAA
jgi:hypothetical protein